MVQKYSDNDIKIAVKNSESYAGVLRNLGIKQSGGSQSHITRRIKNAGISTEHFTGQSWNKGKVLRRKRNANNVLVKHKYTPPRREKTYLLIRCLDEIGREYICVSCGLKNKWNDKDIVLEVDHINNDPYDDREENLQYLCPNCHSQK